MAIAYVRQVDKQNNTPTLTVPASGCAAGNTVIVAVCYGSATNTFSGVTDSKGNTYAVDLVDTDGVTLSYGIAHGTLTSGLVSGDTLTLAGLSGSYQSQAHEFSGVDTAAPLDKKVSTNGSGTTVNTGNTSSLSSSADLYFAAIRSGAQPLTDTTAGLTNLGNDFDQYHFRYALLGNSSAVSYIGTLASSTGWVAGVATYIPPAAPSGNPVADLQTTFFHG